MPEKHTKSDFLGPIFWFKCLGPNLATCETLPRFCCESESTFRFSFFLFSNLAHFCKIDWKVMLFGCLNSGSEPKLWPKTANSQEIGKVFLRGKGLRLVFLLRAFWWRIPHKSQLWHWSDLVFDSVSALRGTTNDFTKYFSTKVIKNCQMNAQWVIYWIDGLNLWWGIFADV